jgi:CheY-like chemotaxis protein
METAKRILVVEDDPSVRELICTLLESEGYSVVGAENGRVGLEKLRGMPRPGLIVLDLMMPVMNGAEFLAALRADPALGDLPVLLISAYDEHARDVTGIVGYLRKPVSLDRLLEAAARYC